jgi:hypothetical protein
MSDEQHTEQPEQLADPEREETFSSLDLPEGEAETVKGGDFPWKKY